MTDAYLGAGTPGPTGASTIPSGTPIAPVSAGGGAGIWGWLLSAGATGFEVVNRKFQSLKSDVDAVTASLRALNAQADISATKLKNISLSNIGRTGPAASNLSAANISFTPPTTAAGSQPATAAGGGPGTPTGNSGAPVSAFSPGERALGWGALADIGASAAGRINKFMGSVWGGPQTSIDLMARQANTITGANFTPGAAWSMANQMTNFTNQGGSDLAAAMAAIQQNSFLSPNRGSSSLAGTRNFNNVVNALNPAMGAQGAMQFANALTTNQAFSISNRYLGANRGILVNPNGSINSTSTTFSRLLQVLMGGRQLTGSQMQQLARSPGNWRQIQDNASALGLNLSGGAMQELQGFAANGGNIQNATPGGSVAGSQEQRATAQTQRNQSVFEATAGLQNNLNTLAAGFSRFENVLVQADPSLIALGAGAAVAAKSLISLASLGSEAAAAADALKAIRGGGGLGGLGGGVVSSAGVDATAAETAGLAATETTAGKSLLGRVLPGIADKLGLGAAGSLASKLGGIAGDLGKASLPAAALSIGGGLIANRVSGGQTTGSRALAGSIIGGASKDAAYGAMLGSIIPGLGTLVGGGIGAGVGAAAGAASHFIHGGFLGGLLNFLGDPETGSTTTAGLQPNLSRAITAMQRENPNVQITSGHRTLSQQANLYALKGGHQVAAPGHSTHETGTAVDIGPSSQLGWISQNARRFGLYHPSQAEPWHVQAMGDPTPASTTTGSAIVAAALPWQGTPYVWGGTGTQPNPSGSLNSPPASGVDCSRFVQEVFASVGISLPRLTYQQVGMGTPVNGLRNAQPGDLLFFNYEGPNSHVAIYLGNGKQIAAPSPGSRVQIQPVDMGHLDAIRRVVQGGKGKQIAVAAANMQGGSSSATGITSGGSIGAPPGLANTFISDVNSLGWMNGGGGSTIAAGGGYSGGSGSGVTSNSGSVSANTYTGSGPQSVAKSRLVQILLQAGWPKSEIPNALGVIQNESGGNPSVQTWGSGQSIFGHTYGSNTNPINGSQQVAVGLFQDLLTGTNLRSQILQLENPVQNARIALQKFQSRGWEPWTGDAYINAHPNLLQQGDPGGASVRPFDFGPSGGGGVSSSAIQHHFHIGELSMPIQLTNGGMDDAKRFVQMIVSATQEKSDIAALGGR